MPFCIPKLKARVARGNTAAMNHLAYLLESGESGVPRDVMRAKQLYERAVGAGNADAMNNLGRLLHTARGGVPKDAARAKQLYARAVKHGNVDAMNNLGALLCRGDEGVPKDSVRAKLLYERAVDCGSAVAMNALAYLLHHGAEGVPKDVVRAKQLYVRAIEGGDVLALYNLAQLLHRGEEGVPKDVVRAKELYERAVRNGDIDAMTNLGKLLHHGEDGVLRNGVQAKLLYEQAVIAGSVDAMNHLGRLLHTGQEGVTKDAVRAKQLYECAVKHGNVDAMNNLSALLCIGDDGVPKDAKRAKQLYDSAVKLGNVDAMNKLSVLLRRGDEGVPKNAVRAKQLCERAVDNGSIVAMNDLGYLLYHGEEGVPKDVVRAKRLYERAVDCGSVSAMTSLGHLLHHSEGGIPKDVVRAKELYERAVDNGDANAMTSLGNLLLHGDEGVLKNAVGAMQMYERAVHAGNIDAMNKLGFLLHHGEESVPKDGLRAKQLYERAVHCGDVNAIYNLGHLLELGEVDVPRDVVRAKWCYELGAHRGHAPSRRALARLLEECSPLSTAFCLVLKSPDVLDLVFLCKYVRAGYVTSASDLLAGHNLILLALRIGVLTRSTIATVGGSPRYFQENLYLPATKLNTGNDKLILSVFLQAESIGLIRDDCTMRVMLEPRADVHQDLEAISEVFENLAHRVVTVEQHVSRKEEDVPCDPHSVESLHLVLVQTPNNQQTLQGAMVNFASCLRQLQSISDECDHRLKYTRLSKCVLSFIPVMCAALQSTTEVFMHFRAEDFVQVGNKVPNQTVWEMAFVDLSNFQVARLILSNKLISKLSHESQADVKTAIKDSGLTSAQTLESILRGEIECTRREKPSLALLDVGISSWIDEVKESSSEVDNSTSSVGKNCFQLFARDRKSGTLSIGVAVDAVNHYLKCQGLALVDEDKVEIAFLELSREDEEEVREEVFLRILQTVSRAHDGLSRTGRVAEEGRQRFQMRATDRGSLSLQLASRVLSNLSREMTQNGLLEKAWKMSVEEAAGILKTVCGDSDRRIDEITFVEALMVRLNQLT